MAAGTNLPAHSISEDRKYERMTAFTFIRNHASDPSVLAIMQVTLQWLEHSFQLLHEEVHIEEKSESSMKHQKNR
jgi:hypothetical protein